MPNGVNKQTIQAGGGSTPGGSNLQVQYNNAGSFGGDPGLTYDSAADILKVLGKYEVINNLAVPATLTNPTIQATNDINAFTQIGMQNKSALGSSSADIIAYPNNVTSADDVGFVDIGITSTGFNDPLYAITKPNDAYLFGSAGPGGTYNGDLIIATDASGTTNDIIFYTDGFDNTANERMRITDTAITCSENISAPNLSGTNTGDQTSIVGITGTKAQFDTAVTDGNILYVGDITQYTDEMAQDAVGAMVDSTLTYTDVTPLLAVTPNTTVQKIEVVKNSGAVVGTRKQLNFIEGTNVTLTVTDDGVNDQVDVTINSTAGGGSNAFSTIAVSGQSDIVADSATDTLTIVAGTNVTLTTNAATDTLTINASTGGVSDGDKGDITVSSSGTVWTIDNDTVTYAKIQNVTATDKLLGRSTAGAGDIEEIACTAAGRAILDDADASAQRTTLGLGTLATQSGTFSGTSSGTNTGDQNLFSTIAVSGQSNVVADTTSDTLTLVAGTNITITTNAATDEITINAAGGGISDGDKGDITVSGSGATWTIDNDVVTYAKMQNVSATSRIMGRITGGAGDMEEMTGTQTTTLLDTFTDALKGLVPASGGGTANFLRADGVFAAPPGGGSGLTQAEILTRLTFRF